MSRIYELHGGEVAVAVPGMRPEPLGCASRSHRYSAIDPRRRSGGGSSTGHGVEHEDLVTIRGGVTTQNSEGVPWITTI